MSAFIAPRDPYELFVHLSGQFARLQDRSSQSKMWQLFSSVMGTQSHPGNFSSHHIYDISDPHISAVAEHLNTLVTDLLQAPAPPQAHLLESITFNAHCLEIVRNLQEQLRCRSFLPDARMGQLESNLIALSEKWLHYLVEEPGRFLDVLQNPATSPLALAFLERKWNVLTQFLGSWVTMPPWPPSHDAALCLAAFEQYQTQALAIGRALSDRCVMLQGFFACPDDLRENVDHCKALLATPTQMDEEDLKFLSLTLSSFNNHVEYNLQQLVQSITESMAWLDHGVQTGQKIDPARLEEIKGFFRSIPAPPQGTWMSSPSVPDLKTWVPHVTALNEMRSTYFVEMLHATEQQIHHLLQTQLITEEERRQAQEALHAVRTTPLTQDTPWPTLRENIQRLLTLKALYTSVVERSCSSLRAALDVTSQLLLQDGPKDTPESPASEHRALAEEALAQCTADPSYLPKIELYSRTFAAYATDLLQRELQTQAAATHSLRMGNIAVSESPTQPTPQQIIERGREIRDMANRFASIRMKSAESVMHLRQLTVSLTLDMSSTFRTLIARGEMLESPSAAEPSTPAISLADFEQQSDEFQTAVLAFETQLIRAFSSDLEVSEVIGEKIFRGAQRNWKDFFVEREGDVLEQIHEIPHLKIYKIPGTHRLVAEYGRQVIGEGTYKRAKEVQHIGEGVFVRLGSSLKNRERELQSRILSEWNPEKLQKLKKELEDLQQDFLKDIAAEEWARKMLEGVSNIAGITKIRYMSKAKPGKPSQLKTRYIMTKYDGSLRSLVLKTQDLRTHLQALECCRGVFRCLSEMHQRGFIHADLSLGNVLFSGNTGFVSDFGLFASQRQKLTYIGHPAYMAPETFFHQTNPTYSPEMDLFSLGILLLGVVDPSLYRTWETVMMNFQPEAEKYVFLDKQYQDLIHYEHDLLQGRHSLSYGEVTPELDRVATKKREILIQRASIKDRYSAFHTALLEDLKGGKNPFNPLIQRLISYNPSNRTTCPHIEMACAEAEREFTAIMARYTSSDGRTGLYPQTR